MAGADTQRVIDWVCDRLGADATLIAMCPGGVHDSTAPPSTAYPFVEVSEAGNYTVAGAGGIRIMVRSVVLVKVIDAGVPQGDVVRGESFDAIREAAERVDALLQGYTGATALLTVVDVIRESEHRAPYIEDGVSYRELGGYYRVYARAS